MPLNRYFLKVCLINCSDSIPLCNIYIINKEVTYIHPFPVFALDDTLAEQERQEKLISRIFGQSQIFFKIQSQHIIVLLDYFSIFNQYIDPQILVSQLTLNTH